MYLNLFIFIFAHLKHRTNHPTCNSKYAGNMRLKECTHFHIFMCQRCCCIFVYIMHNFQIFWLLVQSQTFRFQIPNSYRVKISMRFCYKVQSMSMRTFKNISKRHKHLKKTILLWFELPSVLENGSLQQNRWCQEYEHFEWMAILLELWIHCSKENET